MSFEPTGNKIISICMHCEADVPKNTKLCKFCSTAEMRRKADEENLEINPKFKCNYCEKEKRRKEMEKELRYVRV